MSGKDQKIATDLLHIEGAMPGALRRIDERGDPERASARTEVCHWINGAQCVRDVRECEKLDITREPLIQAAQVEQTAIAGDRQINELNPDPFSKQLPWNNVAVMLHLGEQDLVPAF